MFVDFFLYMVRTVVYAIGKALGKEYKLFANEDFQPVSDPSFKFTLLSSFKGKKEVPLSILFANSQKLFEANPLKNLAMHMRFSDATPSHWTEQDMQEKVPPNATKIFIVGPQAFTEGIAAMLTALKYNPRTFVFL